MCVFSNQRYEGCVKAFLVLFSVLARQKVNIFKVKFINDIPSVWNSAFPKSDKNPENDNDVITCRQHVIVGFLLKSSCFSCHFEIVVPVSCQYHYWISSMTIFIYKWFDWKSGNCVKKPVWNLHNIWGLGRVKLGMNLSNE